MGTDNIIKDFYYNEDGSEDDFTGWTAITNGYTNYNTTVGAEFVSTSRGGYYQQLLRNRPTEEWEFTVILQHQENENSLTNNAKAWIKLNDGNYYCVGIEGQYNVGGEYYAYQKTSTRPSITYDRMEYITTPDIPENYYCALTLRFKTNGQVDVIKKFFVNTIASMRTQYPTKKNLHDLTGDLIVTDAFAWSGAKIEEIGFINAYTDNDNNVNTRWYGMYIDANEATPEGGDATIDNVISTTAMSKISSGAGGTIIAGFNRDDTDAIAIIEANLRQSYIVQETTYGNYILKGEITDYKLGVDTVTYYISDGVRKLTEQFANTNPILYDSDVLKTIDNVIYDEFADWTIDEWYTKILTTYDDNLYSTKIFPSSVKNYLADEQSAVGWVETTPDTIGGDIEYLYFDNRKILQGSSWVYKNPLFTNDAYGIHYINDTVTSSKDTAGMEIVFKVWYKDGTVFDTLNIKSSIRFTSLKSTKVEGVADEYFPRLFIYSTNTSTWLPINNWTNSEYSNNNVETSEEWDDDNIELADGSAGKSPIFDDEFIVTDIIAHAPNNYLQNISSVNDSGFRTAEIVIRLKSASVSENIVGVPDKDPKMEVHYLSLELDQVNITDSTILQSQEVSVGYIDSNTASSITISNVPTWSVHSFPQADGVTVGDNYLISENIESIITAIFNNANTDFTVEPNFSNNYQEYGEIEDLTYTYIYEYINKISDQFNWAFWYQPTTETNVIKIADNFESTGITLTKNDIVDYDSSFTMKVDDNNLAEKIVVIGAKGVTVVHTNGDQYNVDVNNSFGDREVLYRDDELYSLRSIEAFATSKHAMHSKVSYSCEVTLDYNSIPSGQNYSTIAIGKTISLDVNEYPLYSAVSEDNEELFIEAMTYRRLASEGWQQFITLHLMRRVV